MEPANRDELFSGKTNTPKNFDNMVHALKENSRNESPKIGSKQKARSPVPTSRKAVASRKSPTPKLISPSSKSKR